MKRAHRLHIGSRIWREGEAWTVTGFFAGEVALQGTHGRQERWHLATLTRSPDFRIMDDEDAESSSDLVDVQPSVFLDNINPELRKEAEALERHLLEASTGYKAGQANLALEGEPRSEYDPDFTTLTQRMEAKANELEIARSSLFRHRKRYEQLGLLGLVDARKLKVAADFPSVDHRVRQALLEVLHDFTPKSNVTMKQIRARTARRIQEAYPDEEISFPHRETFNKLLKRTADGMGLDFQGSAKGRRSAANRPARPYRRQDVTRPGEVVVMDTYRFDAYALDPVTFKWVRFDLSIALDLYSRSILAWRFAPTTNRVDAALLLYDMLHPKKMRDGWPEHVRWPYVGIPETIVIELLNEDGDPDLSLAGIPFLRPETVWVDRGRVYISRAFTNACIRLGADLQLARPYVPTDKAHVERVFRTIRDNFVELLPGYTGPDVFSRGASVEDDAFFFLDEIEELFAQWVAEKYQPIKHSGLHLPSAPKFELSPNEMYDEGIHRAGFVYMPPDPSLYFDLLPTAWRVIHHYGVDLNGLKYDSDAFADYRNLPSPYVGVNNGKWPIRYDPRDLSEVFFLRPDTQDWFAIPRIGNKSENRPFDHLSLSYVKALFLNREQRSARPGELSRELDVFLDRIERLTIDGTKERRVAALRAMRALEADKSKIEAAPQRSDPTPSPLPPDGDVDLESMTDFDFASLRSLQPSTRTTQDDDAMPDPDVLPIDFDDDEDDFNL